jgi:hypothetical protein
MHEALWKKPEAKLADGIRTRRYSRVDVTTRDHRLARSNGESVTRGGVAEMPLGDDNPDEALFGITVVRLLLGRVPTQS